MIRFVPLCLLFFISSNMPVDSEPDIKIKRDTNACLPRIWYLLEEEYYKCFNKHAIHVCKVKYKRITRYYTQCWKFKWAKWMTCTRYQYKDAYKDACCPGWANLPECTDAICGGKTGPRACSISYAGHDNITYINGKVQTNSGGICSSPDNCINCTDGFYSTGPRCEICPLIPNCHHRRCKNTDDNHCTFCYYENKPEQYHRAYKYDAEVKGCRKTCSWRSDSTRCFPGICSTEFEESCTCTKGFKGKQCDQITQPVAITYANIAFYDIHNNKIESPSQPNYPNSAPKYWTNNVDLNVLKLDFCATYKPIENVTCGSDNHYVTCRKFKYGIIRGELKAYRYRSGNCIKV